MKDQRRELGRRGERLAEEMLRAKGYTIVARNVHFRQGELDLVAWDQGTLVFVEVRTKSSTRYGTAAESITWKKKQRLRRLAYFYLQENRLTACTFRIDVVTVHFSRSDQPAIHHFMNAC